MTDSSEKLTERFNEKLTKGIPVKKISKDRPQYECKIQLNEDKQIAFVGDEANIDPDCVPQKIENLSVRRATDPDPEQKHFAGSKVLRDNLDPREAMKAFIVVANGTTTINLLAETESEAEVIVTGFHLLIKQTKGI
jgi:hypothetical protein